MRFKDVRDRERGNARRIEELEEALEHILLACETADSQAVHWSDSAYYEAVELIHEKAEKTLNKG